METRTFSEMIEKIGPEGEEFAIAKAREFFRGGPVDNTDASPGVLGLLLAKHVIETRQSEPEGVGVLLTGILLLVKRHGSEAMRAAKPSDVECHEAADRTINRIDYIAYMMQCDDLLVTASMCAMAIVVHRWLNAREAQAETDAAPEPCVDRVPPLRDSFPA